MSTCAKIYCGIYRDKRYCSKAGEKERNGVCDCRHARYGCEAGKLCARVESCSEAPEAAAREYGRIRSLFIKASKEAGPNGN